MKYTHGPWIVSADGCHSTAIFKFLISGDNFTPDKKGSAVDDCRLITAAPTMYEYIEKQAKNGDKEAMEIIKRLTN